MRTNQREEGNPSWKGGISPKNRRIRNGAQFAEWRQGVFERDNFTCQDCGARSARGKRVELHPHHIKSFAEYPELRFDVNNGVTFCANCHKRHTAWQRLKYAHKNKSGR